MVDINSISPSLRDNLLAKNLVLSDYDTRNNFTGLGSGLGKPIELFNKEDKITNSIPLSETGNDYRILNKIWNKYVGVNTDVVIENLTASSVQFDEYITPLDGESNLDKNAIENRKRLTGLNEFIDINNQTAIDLSKESLPIRESKPNYIDYISNVQNNFISNAANTIQSIFGTQLNVSSTLTGALLENLMGNDTKLGATSKYYLSQNIKDRIVQNAKNETVGQINTDIFGLLNGESFLKDDFKITTPSTVAGKVIDTIANTIGLENDIPDLPDLKLNNYSYFSSKTLKQIHDELITGGSTGKTGNFLSNWCTKLYFGTNSISGDFNTVNSALIKNSGKGQMKILYQNLSNNLYTPNYSNFPGNNSKLPDNEYLGNSYKKDITSLPNGTIHQQDEKALISQEYEINWINNDTDPSSQSLFDNRLIGVESDSQGNNVTNEYASKGEIIFGNSHNQRSLLEKTNEMFKNGIIKTMNSSKYLSGEYGKRSEINNAISEYNGQVLNTISKGNNVVSSIKDGKPVFCRVWTFDNKYSKVSNLVRHQGLIDRNGISSKGSVLDDNGFVKISPYKTDKSSFKKFMFSIENLAWGDYASLGNLYDWEIGNGDPATGTKGRIMWFPPYDLTFNETTTPNWETTPFLGRPEPIYTYSYTERSGNLSFKIIVDHSEYVNNIVFNESYSTEVKEGMLQRFFAGCGTSLNEIQQSLTLEQQRQLRVSQATKITKKIKNNKSKYELKVYFPNGYSGNKESDIYTALNILLRYENGKNELSYTPDDYGHVNDVRYNINSTDFNMNSDFIKFISKDSTWQQLIDILKESKNVKLKIYGYASKHGNLKSNQTLSDNRAALIKNLLLDLYPDLSSQFEIVKGKGESNTDGAGINYKEITVDTKVAKENRYVQIYADYEAGNDENEDNTPVNNENIDNTNSNTGMTFTNGYYNEGQYFEKLSQDNPFAFEKISEKLRYFQPGFHSTSPIGLNSRLTFLQQCCRAGRVNKDNITPNNLTFGRPPICILRIGDFFHTKVIIENMSINYEPLVWDLNPEGIGVQPMIAHIDLSIKIIGGSDLGGPINILQNAMEFNFYANTSTYEKRSNYITIDDNGKATFNQGINKVS